VINSYFKPNATYNHPKLTNSYLVLEGGGGDDDAYLVLADMVCVDHCDLCPPR